MEKSRGKRSNLFYRYLISYIIVFLIPLLVFGAVLYNNTLNVFKKEVEGYNLSKLSQMAELFDGQIKSLEKTAIDLSFNRNLYPYIIEDNEYWENNKFEELKIDMTNNVVNNPIIDEIFLCLKDKDFTLTSRGKMPLDVLFNNIIKIDGKNAEVMMDNINSLNTPVIFKVPKKELADEFFIEYNVFQDNSDSYTFYAYPARMYPIPSVKNENYGVFFFRIKSSKVEELMKNVLGSMVGGVYILDNESNEVFKVSSDDGEPELPLDIIKDNIIQEHETSVSDIRYNNRKMSVIDIKSALSGYRYVAVVDDREYINRIKNLQNTMLVTLLLVVFTGVIMASLSAVNNYRPVKALINRLKNTINKTGDYKRENEFKTIENTIYNILEEKRIAVNMVSVQRPFVLDQIFFMLLKGNISLKHSIDDLLEHHNIKMDSPYYMVSILSICKNRDRKSEITFKEFSFYINSFLKENFNGNYYSLEILHGDIVLIFNSSYETLDRCGIDHLLTALQELLYDNLKIKLNVGVGRIYKEISDISNSFSEALSALEYCKIKGSNNIMSFNDLIDLNEKVYWYPVEEQTRIMQFLKQGNMDIFQHEVADILESIKEKGLTVGMTKVICFGIITCIINMANELGTDSFNDEIEELTDFKTLDDLQGRLERVAYSICSYINEKSACGKDALKFALVEFVHKHYTDSSLSLGMLAEEFDLTTKYISRIFKEYMGCRFADYVKQLRVKRAKKLLEDSDMSIKDIVNAVGYIDASNFTRTFRFIEGITPSEFREIKT